mmetsp:Transcript_38950/g.120373  ORF Transcript_38950/g.120373 Transcript_38950/m.120373 type:complete len:955 (-) Transcript_38950:399-3263(-)
MSHVPQTPTEQQRAAQSGPREVPPGAHFAALMSKNIKLKLRQPVTTCVEFVIPLLFMLGLILIWAISASSDIAGRNLVPNGPEVPVDRPWESLQRYACVDPSTGLVVPGLRNCTATERAAPNFECMTGSKVYVPNGLCLFNRPAKTVLLDSWNFDRPRAVGSFDEVVLYKWIAEAKLTWLDRFNFVTRYQSSVQGSGIILADETPTGDVAQRFADYLNRTTGTFRHVFLGPIERSEQAALDRNTVKENAGFAMAIIAFRRFDAGGVSVTFYQNRSGSPTTAITFEKFTSQGLGELNLQNWHTGGLLAVQQAVATFYHTTVLGQTTASQGNATSAMREAATAPTPFISYVNNQFYIAVGDSISLIVTLAFLFPVSQLTKRIVVEKELRLREAMMIMGLSNISFYASWFLTYLVQAIASSLLIAIVSAVTMLPKADFGVIFFLFLLFSISTIGISFIFSTVFSLSRTAALMAPALFFVIAVPSFALSSDAPAGVMVPLSLLSPVAFGACARLLFSYEVTEGLTAANLNNGLDEVPAITYLVMLGIDIFLYLFIALYLDQVIPSQWGTRRHPLFCIIDPIRWCMNRGKKDDREQRDREMHAVPDAHEGDNDSGSLFEPQSAREEEPSVEIRKMRKVFGDFVAVKGLDLPMYQDEVTVLLGHNGAGKTTTIGCMMGMLGLDGGDCVVYGDSVDRDLPAARQHMGFCPQHNILWDEMTCVEHLEFFARLKGIPSGPEATALAEEMLEAVDLTPKRDFPSSALSGGQKRKLSVAIALIGGPRVVFLDEPSAGMDPVARRGLWTAIQRIVKQCAVVLTTHHLEEVEALAHRVAIMVDGEMRVLGSLGHLKHKFGSGFELIVRVCDAAHEKSAQELIDARIPGAKLEEARGQKLTYALPGDTRLSQTFAVIEEAKQSEDSGITDYGISQTSVEQVFLRAKQGPMQPANRISPREPASTKVEV